MTTSLSIKIQATDSRCKFWAKVIRADKRAALPAPAACEGASDLIQAFSRQGDEELFAGDFVIHAEQNHHRKVRGWTYRLIWMKANGEIGQLTPTSATKASLKAWGMEGSLLTGAGGLAACVRVIHASNLGFDVDSL